MSTDVVADSYIGTLRAYSLDGQLASGEILFHSPSVSWVRRKVEEEVTRQCRQFGFRWTKQPRRNEIVLLHPHKDVVAQVYRIEEVGDAG